MPPERPLFFEGQILAAGDLSSTVEYGRGEAARHERYLHDWGVTDGLELTSTAKSDASGNYVEVTLQPGTAIDGTGREIVVPAASRLSEGDFFNANGASPQAGARYPVLLHGIDTNAPAPPISIGACGSASQPTRTQEGYGLTFGGLGADLTLDQQQLPDVSAGPGPLTGQPWEVLVGFVQWDAAIKKFTAADYSGRRYAGVKADTVSARGGILTLQTEPTPAPGQPALQITGNPPALVFGLYQGSAVDHRLTVDAQGDVTVAGTLTVAGTIKSALAPLAQGDIRVQSGTATDGVIIPLPPGITEDQVAHGGVILHLHLTPHTPEVAAPVSYYVPITCNVDSARRLHCRVLTFPAASPQPGAADYLLVATAAPAPGANP
jgi:hypothetical protein